MTTEIYSRRPLAYAAAGLFLVLCGGMLISFLRDYAKHIANASGSTLGVGILGGLVAIGVLGMYLYGAFRIVRPTRVQGHLARANGDVVTRQHNNLVIHLDGKKYKLPLDSGVDKKLNALPPSEVVQVEMDVGAFGSILSLRVRG